MCYMSPLQLLDDEIDDTDSECVICKCEVWDTVILTCLCIICLICLCMSYMSLSVLYIFYVLYVPVTAP